MGDLMDLPAGYSIRKATTEQDFNSFAILALDYQRWLNVDLCFQAFEQELSSLPGCYSSPAGVILLLSHQSAPDQAPVDVGCVALRPLHTNTSATQLMCTGDTAASHTGMRLDTQRQCHQHHHQQHQEQQQERPGLTQSGPGGVAVDITRSHLNQHQPEQQQQQQQQQHQSPSPAAAPCAEPVLQAAASSSPSVLHAGPSEGRTPPPHLTSTCEMKRLWVAQEHTRQGLGKALAAAAVSAGQSCGYRHMVLDTLQSLTSANKLYRGLGFVQRGPYYDNPLTGVVFWQLEL